MKKTLVAIAALSAISAFAQSSVTAYGIIDSGYVVQHRQNTNAAGEEVHSRGIAGGNQSSSRIGFKGVEDIGGGTKAEFTAEFGVNPNKSNLSGSTNDANDTAFDNRQTFVALSGAAGRVSFGRQYTATHGTIAATDAAGGNNLIGGTTYTGGNSTTDYKITPFYGNSAYIVRASEAVAYTTPSFSGLTATVGASLNKKRTDTSSSTVYADAADARSLSLNYANGPLFVAASVLAAEADIVTTATSASFGGVGMTGTTAGRLQAKQTQKALGATYDLGVAKLFGNYLVTGATGTKGTTNFANDVKRTAWELGARAPIAGKFSGFAKYGKGKTNLTTAADVTAATPDSFNFSAYQAGVDYNLSKRTNAYVIYGHAKADQTVSTQATATAYAIGLRHQF